MLKKVFSLLLVVGLTICCFSCFVPQEYLFNNSAGVVIRECAKDLRRDLGFSLLHYYENCGGECMIYFYSAEHVDVNRARRLYMETVDSLLYKLSRTHIVSDFEDNPKTPLSYQNVLVGIGFVDSKTRFVDDGNIAYVCGTRKTVCYSIYDPEYPVNLRTVHKESYEVVKKILNGELEKPNIKLEVKNDDDYSKKSHIKTFKPRNNFTDMNTRQTVIMVLE